MHKLLAVAAALVCIAAGIYLLDTEAAAEDSLIEVFMHGVGIYFIGKGLFVGSSLWQQDDLWILTKRGLDAQLKKDAGDEGSVAAGSLQRPEGV